MAHPILEDLIKFIDAKYLERDLLVDFNKIYWDRWGISKPHEHELLKTFTISFPDTNPDSGKSREIKLDYDFNKYILQVIRKAFDKLNQLYYHELILLDSDVKKSTFYRQISRELDDFYFNVKQAEHLYEFRKEFNNGILHFKCQNVINSIQRSTRLKNIKNGFTLRDSITQTTRDIDNAYNRLKGMTYLLRKYGFIDKNISPETFVQIFNNRINKEVIEWESCLSSFYYFIKKLNNSELVADHYPYTWGIANKCFNVRNRYGVLYESKKFRSQKPPTKLKQQQLDEILNY